MWDSRGVWVVFVAEPLVGRIPRAVLERAGVRVEGGCWPGDGTFAHDKAMSASYVVGGERRHWT